MTVYLYFDHKLFQLIAGPILVGVASYNHDKDLLKSGEKMNDWDNFFFQTLIFSVYSLINLPFWKGSKELNNNMSRLKADHRNYQ